MKIYKYLKSQKSGDLYVNAILVLLLFFLGICVINACQKKDCSWEALRSKKSGSILLAYIGPSEPIYKDEYGNLHGAGVENFNNFIKHTEGQFNVKIIPEIQKFSNTQEVIKTIKTSNGGVFGWNINVVDDAGIRTLSFPLNLKEKQTKPHQVILKASSDWLPVLAAYFAHKNEAVSLDPSRIDAEAFPEKYSF